MAESSFNQQILVDEPSIWETPGTWILLGTLIVLAIAGILGYTWYETQQTDKIQTAQADYAKAKTPEEKLVIARLHSSSPSSIPWLMEIGNSFYLQSKYDLAAEAFGLIVQKQPNSSSAPGALLGQAEALLAGNKPNDALGLINQLLEEKDKNAYQPLAHVVLARWQIDQKKFSEAKQTLEDLQVKFPGSTFSGDAMELLATLK